MIGGEHYFISHEPVEESMAAMLDTSIGEVSYFSTGRDALFSLLVSLPQTAILLPDLMCHSVYHAAQLAGKQIILYRIGEILVPERIPEARFGPESSVFVMHYFGVVDTELMERARRRGSTVISDVTHLLFDSDRLQLVSAMSDYLVASLRKSGPFPDGGFVSSQWHTVIQPGQLFREDFFLLRASGLLSRGFSAMGGFRNDENFHLLKKAEYLVDSTAPGDYRCSYLSQELLRTIDVKKSVKVIRSNSAVLSRTLEGICLTINTGDTVSPYFLCCFDNHNVRDAVRSFLASHRVFCPVHWDTSWQSTPSRHSDICLSIPCDARYEDSQMQFVSDLIRSCTKS